MAEITVTERTREQGRRLKALRKRLKVSKPILADRLGFGSTQTFDLYERGVSVIRLDRVSDWAAAYGISEREFLEIVINGADDDPSWSLDAVLREAGVSDALFKRAIDMAWGESVALQKRIAEAIISIDRDMRGVSEPPAHIPPYREQQRTTA